MSRTILFWDIDGTLLTTARAGIFAWQDAVDEVLGAKLDLSELSTAGMTDFEIAVLLCQIADADEGEHAAQLLDAYARLLPERLSLRTGQVLLNVRENLTALARRRDVVNMLLTGNVEPGAWAKLRHYGLASFFGAGGAFCREGSDRPSIARAARAMLADTDPAEAAIVIGDTPHDIACGKAIDARTVAVASGPTYDLPALEEHSPWLALERLPGPDRFARLLGL